MRVGTRRLRSCLSLIVAVRCRGALIDPLIAEGEVAGGRSRQGARLGRASSRRRLPPLTAWFARDIERGPGHAGAFASARVRRRQRRPADGARRRWPVAACSGCCSPAGLVCATPLSDLRARVKRSLPEARAASRARTFACELLARRHRKFARDLAARLARPATKSATRRASRPSGLRYVARVLRATLPRQAHARLPRDARRGAGRARPVQRRRDRRRVRERAIRARRRRGRRRRARRVATRRPWRSNLASQRRCGDFAPQEPSGWRR